MPHIVVEYTETLSNQVDIPKLLSDLHYDLAGRETVNLDAIKTRAIPVQYAVVGDGKEKMIHVTLRLLPGRSDELKSEMAQGLFDIAVKERHDDRVKVSVEVVDMHAESYKK